MTDENRRPGDWQRRDLRENANVLIDEKPPSDKKWYQQTFWIIFFVLIFWPVGLVLLWKSNWNVVVKILLTLFVAFTVYFWWAASQAVMQLQV